MQFKTAFFALSGLLATLGSVAAAPAPEAEVEARELQVSVSALNDVDYVLTGLIYAEARRWEHLRLHRLELGR